MRLSLLRFFTEKTHFDYFALTIKNICSIIASIQKMEGESMKTTYDKIVELLKKATEKQLRIIYQVVKTMLED